MIVAVRFIEGDTIGPITRPGNVLDFQKPFELDCPILNENSTWSRKHKFFAYRGYLGSQKLNGHSYAANFDIRTLQLYQEITQEDYKKLLKEKD